MSAGSGSSAGNPSAWLISEGKWVALYLLGSSCRPDDEDPEQCIACYIHLGMSGSRFQGKVHVYVAGEDVVAMRPREGTRSESNRDNTGLGRNKVSYSNKWSSSCKIHPRRFNRRTALPRELLM